MCHCQQNNCGCSEKTVEYNICNPCPPEPCTCPVEITTNCITLAEDLSCSGVLAGTNFTEALQQVDEFICDALSQLGGTTNLINVGTGVEIYKGIDGLGRREIRSITSNDQSIIVTQNTNTIDLSLSDTVTSPLQLIDEGNGEGIILRNRNPLNYANVGFSALDLSKSLSASSVYGAKGQFSAILNGQDQEITSASEGSIIGAGFKNYINAKFSGILAGTNGIIDGVGGGVSYLIVGGLGNTISENSFVGVSTILNGNLGTVNSYYATLLNGDSNTIDEDGVYGFIGSGDNNLVSAYQALILQGSTNIASGVNSTVINGNNSSALGNASIVLNGTNTADSFAEITGGYFGTTYTPASRTAFNTADRIFNIGIDTDNSNRKDGLSLFKNGVVLLPELTIAKINAASNKVAITKEYLTNYIDGTETKVTAGTNVTVTGNGSIATPYIINSTGADGSETKINAGTNISITGTGTTGTPYTINNTLTVDGSETKITSGTTTAVAGDGTIATPYTVEVKNNQKILTHPADFTGTNYTLTNSDFDTLIFINNGATSVTITVPTGLVDKFYSVFIRQGSGEVTFVASGTTINTPVGLRINLQNDHTCLDKVGSTEVFHLTGNTKV